MEGGRKSNKIRDIVRLHQLLKRWKNRATTTSNNNNNNNNNNSSSSSSSNSNTGNKINKFLKKTLSFSENTVHSVSSMLSNTSDYVPKGYLAVSVGREEDEKKRYVIPTEYLGHTAFRILLQEAEEEFGFHQQGVLQIPCDVEFFENVVNFMINHHDHEHDQEMVFEQFHHYYHHNVVHSSSHAPLCV